jgi:type II secretory pathway pseudopilin PulG
MTLRGKPQQMSSFRRSPRQRQLQRQSAFTLLEILVVIAIIMMLAAILFPAFSGAQERARQSNCASNLQQLYQAVRLYYDDEKRYPENIVALLPEGMTFYADYPTLAAGNSGNGVGAANAPGYLKGGRAELLCPSDTYDYESLHAYSSYGPIGYGLDPLPSALNNTPTVPDKPVSFYLWNYWGYNANGYAYQSASEVAAATPPSNLLRNPALTYNGETNPLKFSLSNRFAPDYTIITHCPHHRFKTAENLNDPAELYANPQNSRLARDIVLRKNGSARLVDVSNWKGTTPANNLWISQKP